MPKLSIYPAIGAARIGNSEEFFVASENPGIPSRWNPKTRKFDNFKDGNKNILRQAAPFRIFLSDDGGGPPKEVKLSNGFKIQWTIHVANRKASFFSFNGQSGARTKTLAPYVGRELPNRAAADIEKP